MSKITIEKKFVPEIFSYLGLAEYLTMHLYAESNLSSGCLGVIYEKVFQATLLIYLAVLCCGLGCHNLLSSPCFFAIVRSLLFLNL